MNDPLFGKYCKIKQGYNGEEHIYKILTSGWESNGYSDVPLTYETENNRTLHSESVPVLNVVHCGISEEKVIRVALKDVVIV